MSLGIMAAIQIVHTAASLASPKIYVMRRDDVFCVSVADCLVVEEARGNSRSPRDEMCGAFRL